VQRQLIGTAAVFVATLFAAKLVLPYAAPFVIAVMAVVLLDPLIARLEQHRISRTLASFALVLAFFAGTIGIISILLTALWAEVNRLQQWSQWLQASSDLFLRWQQLIAALPYPLSEAGPILAERIRAVLADVSEGLVRLLTAIPEGLFVWLIAAMSAFFVCKDKALLGQWAARHLPAGWNRRFRQLKRGVLQSVLAYLRIQLMLVGISTGFTIAVLSLMGIRFAVALGLTAGLLDLMPGVGPGGVYIPIVVVQLVQGRYDLAAAAAVAGLILFLARQLCEPHLIRSTLGLHPLATIAALYIGYRLLGVVGLFLGPLAAVTAQALYRTVNLERK